MNMANVPAGSLDIVCELLRGTNRLLEKLLVVDEKRMAWLVEEDRKREAERADEASRRGNRWLEARRILDQLGFDPARIELGLLVLNYCNEHGQDDVLRAVDEIMAGRPARGDEHGKQDRP
jgi:hypothetical protein